MYIRKIILKNIRGFVELEFDLSGHSNKFSGWTVITGDNAAGKTALLRAIAMALVGPDTTRALLLSLDGWVHAGATIGEIAVEIIPGDEDRFAGGGAPYKDSFWSELKFTVTDRQAVLMEAGNRRIKKKKGPKRGPWDETTSGWFCVGYGPFRRLYGHSPEAQRLMSTRGKVTRFATLFREDATLAESDLWLKDLKHQELEGNEEAKMTLQFVLAVLNKDFFPSDITVDRVDSGGLWLKQPDGTALDLRDMSDGFRSAAALIMDLMRHLVDVYGPEGLVGEDGTINRGGVVLVDEIDAHLHPEWQRKIGTWFKKLFPKIQFIVTTHSPLICQVADEGGIFHLPAPNSGETPFRISDEDYRKIIAGKPESILLSPAFALEYTRSPRAVSARREYSRLEAKKRHAPLSSKEEKRQLEIELFVEEG